jgi:hypothetical protein
VSYYAITFWRNGETKTASVWHESEAVRIRQSLLAAGYSVCVQEVWQ